MSPILTEKVYSYSNIYNSILNNDRKKFGTTNELSYNYTNGSKNIIYNDTVVKEYVSYGLASSAWLNISSYDKVFPNKINESAEYYKAPHFLDFYFKIERLDYKSNNNTNITDYNNIIESNNNYSDNVISSKYIFVGSYLDNLNKRVSILEGVNDTTNNVILDNIKYKRYEMSIINNDVVLDIPINSIISNIQIIITELFDEDITLNITDGTQTLICSDVNNTINSNTFDKLTISYIHKIINNNVTINLDTIANTGKVIIIVNYVDNILTNKNSIPTKTITLNTSNKNVSTNFLKNTIITDAQILVTDVFNNDIEIVLNDNNKSNVIISDITDTINSRVLSNIDVNLLLPLVTSNSFVQLNTLSNIGSVNIVLSYIDEVAIHSANTLQFKRIDLSYNNKIANTLLPKDALITNAQIIINDSFDKDISLSLLDINVVNICSDIDNTIDSSIINTQTLKFIYKILNSANNISLETISTKGSLTILFSYISNSTDINDDTDENYLPLYAGENNKLLNSLYFTNEGDKGLIFNESVSVYQMQDELFINADNVNINTLSVNNILASGISPTDKQTLIYSEETNSIIWTSNNSSNTSYIRNDFNPIDFNTYIKLNIPLGSIIANAYILISEQLNNTNTTIVIKDETTETILFDTYFFDNLNDNKLIATPLYLVNSLNFFIKINTNSTIGKVHILLNYI